MTTRVGFSTPKGFAPASWLVRKLTKSEWSHAFFVYFDQDWGADMVLEASAVGFRILPLEKYVKKNHCRLLVPAKPIDEGVKKVALTFVGDRFDYEGLLGMVVPVVGGWLKRKWRNPFRSADKVFCSESVALAARLSPGYLGGLPETDVTPQQLLEWFEAQIA